MKNKKWLVLFLLVAVVLNVILITRPAFGVYTGEVKSTKNSGGSYSSKRKYTFYSGRDVSLSAKYEYYIGNYMKIGDKMVFVLFNVVSEGYGSEHVEVSTTTLKRNSVFKMSELPNEYFEAEYYSWTAIVTQIILGIVYLILLGCIFDFRGKRSYLDQ